ncbi:MAG: extracellular solute-binding protein, partial [Anaerolineales bacterium]|nr:extracellular solute-binding protein [Anaerolineales bacterium]
MRKSLVLLMALMVLALVMSACQPEVVEVTRVVTEVETVTEEVEVTRVVTETIVETVEIEGEMVEVTRIIEVPAEPVEKTVIEFWTTDNEEERVNTYEAVAARYMEMHPDVEIRIVPIEEAGITQRISTAVAANRLPDIVRMGIERVAAFSADGILDEEAATAVIQDIGEDDFRAGPLSMVANPTTGIYSAVPYDGWIQALWYRQDIFDQLGLDAPTSWDTIQTAAAALPGNGNLLYGIALATDPAQNYVQQVFEQVAISNNAWPFDEDGNVTMNTPEMIAALEWYTSLQPYAMPGPQYWRGAREAYQYDQAGMFFYSTYIMD